MSLRTPLGRVLGFGSAKDGTDHFISQRVSAIALAILGLWFLFSMLTIESLSYLDVLRFVASPMNAILLALACITVCYHAWLGIRVVIEDYVHSPGLKVFSLIASRFAHALVAIVCVYSILVLGLGT